MSFIRTKEIPPGSGNMYKYRVETYRTSEGEVRQNQEYIGKAEAIDQSEKDLGTTSSEKEELTEEQRKELVKELTREGIIVEKEASEQLEKSDIELIHDLEAIPMYLNTELLENIREDKTSETRMEDVRFKDSTPQFTGVDNKVYGPFRGNDKVKIPWENAEILKNRGKIEILRS